MTERYHEPMAESLADIRPSVGTSQGNAVHEDCDKQEVDEDKEPEKDNPASNDSSDSSSSSDSNNDNDDNQGALNHPHDEEELKSKMRTLITQRKSKVKQIMSQELMMICLHFL
nr:hypothetical protein Iba_chr10dCG10750 [Ipomoea batatas]